MAEAEGSTDDKGGGISEEASARSAPPEVRQKNPGDATAQGHNSPEEPDMRVGAGKGGTLDYQTLFIVTSKQPSTANTTPEESEEEIPVRPFPPRQRRALREKGQLLVPGDLKHTTCENARSEDGMYWRIYRPHFSPEC